MSGNESEKGSTCETLHCGRESCLSSLLVYLGP